MAAVSAKNIKLVYPEFFPIQNRMDQRTKTEIKAYARMWKKNVFNKSTTNEGIAIIEKWLDFF